MKALIFSSIAVAGLFLVGLQHQQLGRLRAEKAVLEQASQEATQLKADLAKSADNEAQDEEEIARLREENRDLLKLRNEVNQLRDARVQFEKVSAENQRLKTLAINTPKPAAKEREMRPITIQVNALYDRGLSTPENAVQTYYWGLREGNAEVLSRCVTPQLRNQNRGYFDSRRPQVDGIISIEIAARRDLDSTTVQLGIRLHRDGDPQWDRKIVFVLTLQGGEWRVASGE